MQSFAQTRRALKLDIIEDDMLFLFYWILPSLLIQVRHFLFSIKWLHRVQFDFHIRCILDLIWLARSALELKPIITVCIIKLHGNYADFILKVAQLCISLFSVLFGEYFPVKWWLYGVLRMKHRSSCMAFNKFFIFVPTNLAILEMATGRIFCLFDRKQLSEECVAVYDFTVYHVTVP